MNIDSIKSSFSMAERYSTGIACLYSVIRYWNQFADIGILSAWAGVKRGIAGISGLQKAAVYSGFTTHICKISIEKLSSITEPIILYVQHQGGTHDYMVCYGSQHNDFIIGDTSLGLKNIGIEELKKIWIDNIALILYPNENFPSKTLQSMDIGICRLGKELINFIRSGFIDVNEDFVLYPIDQKAFWEIIYKGNMADFNWFDYIHYLRLRIDKEQNEDEEITIQEMVNRHVLVYILDCLERFLKQKNTLNADILREVELIHKLGLCPEKTMHILAYDSNQSFFKIPLKSDKATFVIPVRIDSAERERNLDILVASLAQMDKVHILIAEGDVERRYYLKSRYQNVEYCFYEDPDPVFYRTKYLNLLLWKTNTEIVGIWDTDVIISEEQIKEAIEAIRDGSAVMSFPFDGRFCMLEPEGTDIYLKNRSIAALQKAVELWSMPYGEYSVGGAFLVNRRIYLKCGGENEHFYGWGPEDAERVKRMEILGMPVFRSEGPLFHLFHPRNANSGFATKELEYRNRKEYLKVCSMTKSELFQYIQTWPWKMSEKPEE